MYFLKEKNIQCQFCGKDFKTLEVQRKYCSTECFKAARKASSSRRRKGYEEIRCANFEKKFGKQTGKITLTCKICGKTYSRYASQIKYRGSSACSLACRSESQKTREPKIQVLDDLWSKKIKQRDGKKCVYCGEQNYLNSHHIFSKTKRSLRWALKNGITLCSSHHTLSSLFSAHKTPAEFVEWIKEKWGIKWYESLREMARKTDGEIPLGIIKEELIKNF